MADKWIKKKPKDVKVGDICKISTEYGSIIEKRCIKDIEINGWYDDEEFTVSELRPYDYVRCYRPFVVYDEFDWSKIYDESIPEDKKILDEMGRNGDKRDSVYFLVTNMLWLSIESKRERELKRILD